MFPLTARAGSVCSVLDPKKREISTRPLMFGLLQPSRHQPEGFTAWSQQGCTVINAVIAEKKANKCSRTSKPLAEAASLGLTFSLVRFLFFRFCIRKVNFYRTPVHMRMSVTSALAWCLAVLSTKVIKWCIWDILRMLSWAQQTIVQCRVHHHVWVFCVTG